MGCYILKGTTVYDRLKSLTFAPEYDPTLATLPICEFEAEIITQDAADSFGGETVSLYEDQGRADADNTLLAGCYEVAEAEQTAPGVVTLRARSLLAWLEKRTLPGEYFANVPASTFVKRLFTDDPLYDGQPVWINDEEDPPVADDGGWVMTSEKVTGYCPEQTARERLQEFCQAFMRMVVQWGAMSEGGLYICSAPDWRYSSRAPGVLIPLENTYWKPTPKRNAQVTACNVTQYDCFTTTERTGEDWGSVILQEGWEDSETGIEQEEIRLYFRKTVFEYNDGSGDTGQTAIIDGNMLVYNAYNYAAYLPRAYYRGWEVEADILQIKKDGTNDTYVWPGDRVRFYADPEAICEGVVESCDFTFGNLAKSRLVISTDMAPVDSVSVYVVFRFKINNVYHEFARRTYVLPRSTYKTIKLPRVIRAWVVDRMVKFVATGYSETGDDISLEIYAPSLGDPYTYNREYSIS